MSNFTFKQHAQALGCCLCEQQGFVQIRLVLLQAFTAISPSVLGTIKAAREEHLSMEDLQKALIAFYRVLLSGRDADFN